MALNEGWLPPTTTIERVDPLCEFDLIRSAADARIEYALSNSFGFGGANAHVILDEAQNTTPVQMKMFLTRLGENARMTVTGDLSQVDLPRGTRSGLRDALETLRDVEEIAVIEFGEADVVRHPLVARIVGAYDARDRQRAAPEDDPS